MALCASDGQPHPNSASRIRPVYGVSDIVFLVNRTPFARGDVASIEAGGDALFKRRFSQQIACQLLSCELIKRHISVEGIDYPVSIGPHFAVVIQMQSVRIPIARRIEPEPRGMFAVFRLRHEGIDEFFISLGRIVCEELMHLFARRR